MGESERIKIDPLLYVRTVAEILQVHENTVYKLVKSGKLEGFKVGSCLRVSQSSVQKYLNLNRVLKNEKCKKK